MIASSSRREAEGKEPMLSAETPAKLTIPMAAL